MATIDFDATLPDPTRPNVTLTIGGKKRTLAFDYRSIVISEKLTGVNILVDIFEASFTTIGAMLFAALLPEDPKLTLEEVWGWIHYDNAPIIWKAIQHAWTGSLTVEGASAGEAPAQEAAGAAA